MQRGFGFKKTAVMNHALLAKIGWRLQSKDNGLWSKIYEAKYLRGTSIQDPYLSKKQNCSSTWEGVLHGVDIPPKGMVWRIGNGETVKF